MKNKFTLYKSTFLMFLLLFMGSMVYGQVGKLDTKQSVTDGYDYVAYLPDGYGEDPLKEWPVLVYLHGGEGVLNGFVDDPITNKALSNFGFGPPSLISNKLGYEKGFSFNTYLKWPTEEYIVIIPHMPRDEVKWPRHQNDQLWDVAMVARVINHAFSRYNEDKDKIFMSGISLGGKGVWDYIMTDAEIGPPGLAENEDFIKPAAAIPISGNAVPANVCNASDVHIWGLHGGSDRQVEADLESNTQPGRWGTKTLIDKFNNECFPTSSRARLSILPGIKHENFTEYYDLSGGYDLFEWLDEHGNDKPANYNVPPFIQLWNIDNTISLEDNPLLTLGATVYNEEEAEQVNLQWSKKSGPSSVVLNGEVNSESVIVKFDEPGTYVFELSAVDEDNNESTKEVTIEVNATSAGLFIGEMVLLDASDNKTVLMTLENGSKIDTEALGVDQFNIGVKHVPELESVRFTLNENNAYSVLRKNTSADYYLFTEKEAYIEDDGEYVISVTPYYEQKPSSDPGISKQYAIYVNQDPPVVLPVEFLNVSAARAANHVAVAWATASEDGNDYFTIERSPSASDAFVAIGTVEGAGDSKVLKRYSFTDYTPLAGSAYYRIKQTDFDGKSDYSKIVSVTGHNQFEASLFPNPAADGETYLKISTADYHTKVEVQVLDAIGNVHYNDKLPPELLAGKDGLLLKSAKSLSAGLYIVLIKQGEQKLHKKLIVK